MEFEWKIKRSGPFPAGIRNTIANLHAALEIREAEASQETTYETTTANIPAPANAATPTTTTTSTSIPAPANTAIPAIHETITTWERLNRVTDTCHVTTPSTPAPAAEGKAEGDKITGDERDIPPGLANGAIEEIEGSPEGRASEGRNPNEEEKETRTEECEKSARTEIPETR
jgi:hypothetical protein